MSAISVGDRVKYRVGRGYALGRVANIAEGMAAIVTDAGKNVNRLVKMLELVRRSLDDETIVVETHPAPEIAQP